MAEERESPRRTLGEPGKRTVSSKYEQAMRVSMNEPSFFLLHISCTFQSEIRHCTIAMQRCKKILWSKNSGAKTFFILRKIRSTLSCHSNRSICECILIFAVSHISFFLLYLWFFNPVLAASRFLIKWFDYLMNLAQWLLLSVFLAFIENARARTILSIRSREVDLLHDSSI